MEQQEKDIIVTASTVAMFINKISHAVAAGAREGVIELHFQNAKDHWERLGDLFNRRPPSGGNKEYDEFAKSLGFSDAGEMNKLISNVDISAPEKMERFLKWKEADGTKTGLLALFKTS
ncbi:MAG: hypothetical protein KDD28_15175 [Phaeodactylibacter sp.]|nr:hypothetical protein [Phaeodactylibacter sp.]